MLLGISALAIVSFGCGGSDTPVVVVNEMTEGLVAQVQQEADVVAAWSIEPNATSKYYGAPLGSSLHIFTNGCIELGRFALRSKEIGTAPAYVVLENGTVEQDTALDIQGVPTPGGPPRVHDSCPVHPGQ